MLPKIQVTSDHGQVGRKLMVRHVCGTSAAIIVPHEDDVALGAGIDWQDEWHVGTGECYSFFETRYGWFVC
jgi:hypothetical protein